MNLAQNINEESIAWMFSAIFCCKENLALMFSAKFIWEIAPNTYVYKEEKV
jgi:hypothetical protein